MKEEINERKEEREISPLKEKHQPEMTGNQSEKPEYLFRNLCSQTHHERLFSRTSVVVAVAIIIDNQQTVDHQSAGERRI